MRIEDLHYFITLSKHSSFNQAAKALNISEQGLSLSVKRLEKYAGAELLIRNSKGVSLTPFGLGFLNHAMKVLEASGVLDKYVETNKKHVYPGITVGLRFSANASAFSSAIYNTVEDFMMLNPNADCKLVLQHQQKILDALKSGEIDVAQVVGDVNNNEFDIFPVFQGNLCVIAKETVNLPSDRALNLSDIKDLPIIAPTEGNPLMLSIQAAFSKSGLKPNIVKNISSAKSLVHMVHKGVGIAFFPDISVNETMLMYPDIKVFSLCTELPFDYSLVTVKKRKKTKLVQDMIGYVIENASKNVISNGL